MKIPVPFLQYTTGLGDVVKAATTAVGVKPCGGCKKRAAALNRVVTFIPAGEIPLPPAQLGMAYETVLPGLVTGGRIPAGLRVDVATRTLRGVPTAAGRYRLTLGSQAYSIEVKE